jgi:murein DD-endopeptidase MepM/ murein hydrolase activator NlpD
VFKRTNRLVDHKIINKAFFIQKLTMCAALAAVFTFGAERASAESTFTSVYHIYLGEEYMGAVDDKQLIEKLVNSKIEKQKSIYENVELTVEDLEIIPEQMFRPVYNNDETLQKLDQELDVAVESTELIIDGQTVANFNSKEDAETVLNKYKLQFVSEEVLKELETRKVAKQPLGPLQVGQSRIVDVTYSEPVSLETKKVSPENVLTVEEGVNLLNKGTLEEKKYKVQEQDVLGEIASKHHLSLEQLLNMNSGLKEDSLIKPGDEINVAVLTPFINVNVKHEVSKKEVISFETEIKEDPSMLKGEEKTTQEGKNGEKLVDYLVYEENGSEVRREAIEEEVIKEPVKEVIVKGTKVIPSRGTGDLAWPAVGGYVSSELGQRWGKLHKGIDIARPSDRTIKAADNGEVISAGYNGGYGNKVVIDHNNGLKTVYAHLDSISVSVGQVVSKGQKLGVMGSTGNSTGVHLHFEVYENGNLENPRDYLE